MWPGRMRLWPGSVRSWCCSWAYPFSRHSTYKVSSSSRKQDHLESLYLPLSLSLQATIATPATCVIWPSRHRILSRFIWHWVVVAMSWICCGCAYTMHSRLPHARPRQRWHSLRRRPPPPRRRLRLPHPHARRHLRHWLRFRLLHPQHRHASLPFVHLHCPWPVRRLQQLAHSLTCPPYRWLLRSWDTPWMRLHRLRLLSATWVPPSRAICASIAARCTPANMAWRYTYAPTPASSHWSASSACVPSVIPVISTSTCDCICNPHTSLVPAAMWTSMWTTMSWIRLGSSASCATRHSRGHVICSGTWRRDMPRRAQQQRRLQRVPLPCPIRAKERGVAYRQAAGCDREGERQLQIPCNHQMAAVGNCSTEIKFDKQT